MEVLLMSILLVSGTFVSSSGYAPRKSISKRCFSCCNCGSVGPVDPYYVTGQKAHLWCSLDQSTNLTAHYLYFMRGNEYFDYKSIISENKKRLDIEFIIYEASKFIGTYYCFINSTSVPSASLTSPVVGKQMLSVENPVKKVSDLQCRIHRPTEEMKCIWDFNEDNYYIDERDIDVKFTAFNGILYDCPNLLNKRECHWNKPGSEHIPVDIGRWEVRVEVKNVFSNHSVVQTLIFDSNEVTLFEPVTRQKFRIDPNECFVFSFDPLPGFVEDEAQIRVSYYDKKLVFRYDKTKPESPPICDMLPFVHYNVSIQIKVRWYKLWGQPAYIDAFNPKFPESTAFQQKVWKSIRNGDFRVYVPIKTNTTTPKPVSAGISERNKQLSVYFIGLILAYILRS